jgi:DNA-binding transcriptional ArsR family regulator
MAHTDRPAPAADSVPSNNSAAARRRGRDEATVETAAETMRLLGDPTRLRLLRALCDDELDVTSLAQVVGADRGRVSQHLTKLRRVGLVDRRKDASRAFYRLRDPRLRTLIVAAFRYASRHNGITPWRGQPEPIAQSHRVR